MGVNLMENSFWLHPFGITLLTLGSLILLGLLSWVASTMFKWFRSRIVLKQEPDVGIVLIRRTAGMVKPFPFLRVTLKGASIFTRQPDGYYWLTGEMFIDKQRTIRFRNEKEPYRYFMDLGKGSFHFEQELQNWSFWDDKGESLKETTFTSILYINDRACHLTKSQKPKSVELWEQ